MNRKTKKWLIFAAIVLLCLYPFRVFLPFMFYNTNYIDVEFHVPEQVTPKISAMYWALSCNTLSFSNFNAIPSKKRYQIDIQQLSPTHYRAKVPQHDSSPCDWSIRSFGWSLTYKDPAALDPRTSYGGGASVRFNIVSQKGLKRYLEGETVLERAYRAEIVDFSDSEMPSFKDEPPRITLIDKRAKRRSDDRIINAFDYNPYSGKTNKITLIATIDESALHHNDVQADNPTGVAADDNQQQPE